YRLWEPLEAAELELGQTVPQGPQVAWAHEAAAPFGRLAENLRADARGDQPPEDAQQVIQRGPVTPIIPVARRQVQDFVDEAQHFAAQPAPSADDDTGRAAWVRVAKVILDKA